MASSMQAMAVSSISSSVAGTMPGREDGIDRAGGILQAGKLDQGGAGELRLGDQAQQGFGDHAQRPFRAGEQGLQVVADHILDDFAAGVQDAPIGQDDGQTQHVVAGHAVFQAARAAGVAGDVPADGRMADAGWVGRVEQPEFFHRSLQVRGDDAGFDVDGGIVLVDLQDAVHARQAQDDPTLEGHRGGRQPGAHAARHHRDALAGGQLHHLADLFGRARQDDHIRAMLFEGAIVAVDSQVFRRGQHAILADDFFELCDDVFYPSLSTSWRLLTRIASPICQSNSRSGGPPAHPVRARCTPTFNCIWQPGQPEAT